MSTTMLMAGGTLVSRVLGFVRAALIAFVLGNGTRPVEAFNLANTIPNSLYILLAGGVMNAVLVPQIVRAMDHDADRGEAYTNRIMTAFLAALAGLTAIVTALAPVVMRIYSASGWRDPDMAPYWHNMVLIAYLCLPQIFFYGAHVLVSQVLNSRQVYIPTMWSPIANNIVSIAVFALYLALWGHSRGDPFTHTQAVLLGLGSTAGIAIQFLILLPFMRRAGFTYRPRFDLRGVGLGHTFRLAQWTLYFVLVNQVAIFVVNRLASTATLGGSGAGITAYQNASLIWIVPHSLVTLSLGTMMVTTSSKLAAANDLAGVAAETVQTMKLAMTVIVPCAVAFLCIGVPLSQLLFGNGTGAADAVFIGRTLAVMSLGLIPFSLHYLTIRSFYALEDTRIPFYIQVAIVVTNVVGALAFVLPLRDHGWVAAGLGGSYALAYVVGLAAGVRLLTRRLPDFRFRPVAVLVGRLLLAVGPAGALAWGTVRLFGGWTVGQATLLGSLALAGVLAIGTFLALARTLRIEEVNEVVASLTRRRPAASTAAVDPAAAPEQADEPEEIAVGETDEPTPVRPLHHTGDVLGGRFRLEEPLRPVGPSDLWRALDLVLKRSVVCQVVPPDGDRTALLISAARRAAIATDARFVRILDVAEDADGSYVVREYAPGRTLASLLADGPLTPREAAWITREVADAMAGMHLQGLHHERITPESVMVTDTGNVKILGFLIDAVLRAGDPLPGSGDAGTDPEVRDVFDIGRLFYACLTGCWPGDPTYGLPSAPTHGGLWMSPAAVDPQVSTSLDRVCQQVIGGVTTVMPNASGRPPIGTASGLSVALGGVLGVADASYELEQRIRRPYEDSPLITTMTQPSLAAVPLAVADEAVRPAHNGRPLRAVPRRRPSRSWLLGLVLVVAVATVVGLIGVALRIGRGEIPRAQEPPASSASPSASASPVTWPIEDAVTFDPTADGGSGDENPQLADRAFDGDDTTRWQTLQYRTRPDLGGLKPGVGLIVDLGEHREITRASVDVLGDGSTVELRVPDDPSTDTAPMDSQSEWRVLDTAEDASDQVDLEWDSPVTTRYVMIYLTKLAPEAGNYRGGIYEVQVGR